LDIFSKRNEGQVLANIVSRLERHQRISHELLVTHVQSAADIWIELSGHHVRDESGRTSSWLFIGSDISRRKQSYVQMAQLITALDIADEPIVIYDVIKPLELHVQHMNARAAELQQPVLEAMLSIPSQRERIKSAWPSLEKGAGVSRLVHLRDGTASQRWVTLELRPVKWGSGSLSSLITIEHRARLTIDDPTDDLALMLALSREILRYPSRSTRRDAFIEVLREEWGALASFGRSNRDATVVLGASDRSGYATLPSGVFFNHIAAVNLRWPAAMAPARLTALRIFLESLGRVR
jgi:PAS domain-containing protein